MNTETPREAVTRWLSDGDTWVGVFENKELGPSLGHRFALPFALSDGSFDKVEVGKSRAPDTRFYIGWRYILVAKCKTVDEVMALIEEDGVVRKPKPETP